MLYIGRQRQNGQTAALAKPSRLPRRPYLAVPFPALHAWKAPGKLRILKRVKRRDISQPNLSKKQVYWYQSDNERPLDYYKCFY